MPKRQKSGRDNLSGGIFPLDLSGGFPAIELLGNRRATIEGSTGVLRYESENIKINTNKAVLSFCGRGLTVKCISETCVIIEGFITRVDFIT